MPVPQPIAIGTEKPRILVVDDESFIRDMLADFLGMEGYAVQCAADGVAALRELRAQPFDVIVSDLKMPGIGGLDLLKEARQAYPDTVMIMMTGFGTVETAIAAMKSGAYDYILKPFKVEEVIQVVERGLARRRLEAENIRLREAVSLYKVSEAISASLGMDDVVNTMAASAIDDLNADWADIWLADGEGGFAPRGPWTGGELKDVVPGDVNHGALVAAVEGGDCVLVHGPEVAPYVNKPDRLPTTMLVVPLKVPTRFHGCLCVARYGTGEKFTEGQRKLLILIASRAAAAIENSRLYENLQATFKQTIQSLARTIDKMDTYTSGHSTRVSEYAGKLARWCGLDDGKIEIVRQAALMHDIGKIGCVMKLNKPGKLTAEEYETFKAHPEYGRDILEPIDFIQPVIPGVHLHHERWDGGGYPLGLSAQSIPLIARIISVADTYDAMTSDRAYRKKLSHDVTRKEIVSCSGTQFDPDVATTFLDKIDDWLAEQRELGRDMPQ